MPLSSAEPSLAALSRSVSFTRFPSTYRETDAFRESKTLNELIAEFRCPRPRSIPKDQLELWSPATFKDDYRNIDNFETGWAIGFDVDVDPVPTADDLRASCGGFAGFFYSSSSHCSLTKKNLNADRRWRLVLLVSRPVNAEEYKRLWRAVAKSLGFPVGHAKDPARKWYVPREPEDPSVAGVFELLSGNPVDVASLLALESEREDDAASVDLPRGGTNNIPEPRRRAFAELLAPAFVEGKRHDLTRVMFGHFRRIGMSQADAHETMGWVAEAAQTDDPADEEKNAAKRLNMCREAFERGDKGLNLEGRPSLIELAGDHAVRALANLDDEAVERRRPRLDQLLAAKHGAGSASTEPGPANDTNALGVCFGGLEQADEPIEYLVDGIIPRSSVCMFVAEPYTLKTFAALDVAIAVAHGRPWLKKHTTAKGRVVYVNFEMNNGELKRRLRLLKDDGGLVGRVSHPDVGLDDEKFWDALAALKPDLVVIDTLSAGNPEVEEKDPRAAAPLRRAARFANETKCSFLFVHHTTKDQSASKKNRVRGTGAIFGALDACYFFEPSGAVGAASSVECIKMRSGPEPEKFFIKLTDARGLELDDKSTTATKPASNKPEYLDKAILLQLAMRSQTAEDLRIVLSKRKKQVLDRLTVLKEHGEVVCFDRKFHLDSNERRQRRILEAVRGDDGLLTLNAVAQAAHVKADDVRPLVKAHTIYKPDTDSGYVVKK